MIDYILQSLFLVFSGEREMNAYLLCMRRML